MVQLQSELPPELSFQQRCTLFGVPRSSGYHAQQSPSRASQTRAAERVRLRDRLEELCLEYPGYGYRRLAAQVQREGWKVGKALVQAILQEESLQCHVKRSWVATTQSQHGYRRYPNLVPALTVTGINQLWVAEIV